MKEEKDLVEKYKEKIQASRKQYEKNSLKAVISSDKSKAIYWALGNLAVIGIIAGIAFWLIKKHKQKSR